MSDERDHHRRGDVSAPPEMPSVPAHKPSTVPATSPLPRELAMLMGSAGIAHRPFRSDSHPTRRSESLRSACSAAPAGTTEGL